MAINFAGGRQLLTQSSRRLAAPTYADTVTIGALKFTRIDPENTKTFDDVAVGQKRVLSNVCDKAYCGSIGFATDGAVANGTGGGVAAPLGDKSNYLWERTERTASRCPA